MDQLCSSGQKREKSYISSPASSSFTRQQNFPADLPQPLCLRPNYLQQSSLHLWHFLLCLCLPCSYILIYSNSSTCVRTDWDEPSPPLRPSSLMEDAEKENQFLIRIRSVIISASAQLIPDDTKQAQQSSTRRLKQIRVLCFF